MDHKKKRRSKRPESWGDPAIIKKLYTCPLCLGKLLSLDEAKSHIELFHRIPMEHQKNMEDVDLVISEIALQI